MNAPVAGVTAADGEPVCDKAGTDPGVYCTRPEGHKGGHLDHVKGAYWQAKEAKS